MRFHTKFIRNKGAGAAEPLLGSDTAPTTKPRPNQDHVLSAHVKASWGHPVHRIAVAYKPPSGSLALNGDLYLYDGLTDSWFKLTGSGAGSIKAGEVSYFDMPAVSDRMLKPQDEESANHAAGFDVALVVTDPGAAPDGAHLFAMAAIVSQKGV